MVLFYFYERDVAAAARTMGLPEGTVKARLAQGAGPAAKPIPDILSGSMRRWRCRKRSGRGGLSMTNERMDEILGTERELVPSSGFLASVMDRVREEAATPPPIPFPWKRAVPGIVLPAVSSAGAPWSWCGLQVPPLSS